jgi:hypothetical protein
MQFKPPYREKICFGYLQIKRVYGGTELFLESRLYCSLFGKHEKCGI